MFRTVIVIIFVVLFLILSLPVLGIQWMIRKKDKKKGDALALSIVSWGLRCVWHLAGVKLSVYGRENIPEDSACLFVANHNSYFDIIVCYGDAKKLVGFVAKKSIGKVPILKTWMDRVNCVFLERDDLRSGLETIKTSISRIEEGISIFIFPEGTRSKDGKLGEFKHGSFKIATKTGCPIVPVALRGTAEIFERQFPWLKPGPVTLYYGKPIYPKDFSKEDQKKIGDVVHDDILNMLNEIDSGSLSQSHQNS